MLLLTSAICLPFTTWCPLLAFADPPLVCEVLTADPLASATACGERVLS